MQRVLFVISIVAAPSVIAAADKSLPPLADRAVDQVSLKRGVRLLGAVVDRHKDGALTLAVSRHWLKASHAAYFDDCVRREQIETKAALVELRGRLDEWRKERAGDAELEFFLEKECERVAKALAELEKDAETGADDASFLLVDLTAADVDRVFVQPAARRQIALVAWSEGLADVETRSAASLSAELKKKKIDPATGRVDLSDRLPVRRQSAAEWAARRAIVEYQYRKPLDFQGTGTVVVRTGEGAKGVDLTKLIPQILQSQLAGQLADLLDEPGARRPGAGSRAKGGDEGWMTAATRTAERENVAGFRVTRLDSDLATRVVSVETRFVARSAAGKWETVWKHVESVDASKPRKDVEDRIANDPQVKKALDVVGALGLGGADDEIATAIRFGAATMEAQQAADSRFLEFRDGHLRRLDGPPLLAPAAP